MDNKRPYVKPVMERIAIFSSPNAYLGLGGKKTGTPLYFNKGVN